MSEQTLNNKDIKDESDNRKAFTYVTQKEYGIINQQSA